MRYRNLAAILVLGLMVGCGSSGSTPCNCPDSACPLEQDALGGGDQDTYNTIDLNIGQFDTMETTMDTGNDMGGEIRDGAFGASCNGNRDCNSGYCIETASGYVCTKTCVTDCPEGWDCRTTMVGQDLVSICIPASATLCKPCKLDTQCGAGHCVEMDNGGYCGLDCKSDDDCPNGYTCQDMKPKEDIGVDTVKQCVPKTLSCHCNLQTAGRQRACERKNEFGRCFGYETCDPEKGWVGCDAPEPHEELCNGMDDNCNGITDEFPKPPEYPCQNQVDGVGTCTGAWECKDGQWECHAATPKTEECNYLDDDCDGETDEDFKNSDGIYMNDTACGNCYTDCTRLWTPETSHAHGVCKLKSGIPVCAYECEDKYVDADGNPDNGCELFLDEDAIYVSVPSNKGKDSDTCGTWDAPCATITYGITKAKTAGKHKVFVSEGIYPEQVVLQDGISVRGGFNAVTWQEAPDTNITIIQGHSQAAAKHKKAVTANNITHATIFSGFTIYGENNFYQTQGENGGNSYGIYVSNSTSALEIRHNIIQHKCNSNRRRRGVFNRSSSNNSCCWQIIDRNEQGAGNNRLCCFTACLPWHCKAFVIYFSFYNRLP